MQITKKDGKWFVGSQQFANADAAMDFVQAEQERIEASKSRPVNVGRAGSEAKGFKNAMAVYYGDQTTNGRYPAMTVYGSQFRALHSAWPEIVAEFNSMCEQGLIDETYAAGSPKAKPIVVIDKVPASAETPKRVERAGSTK